MKNYTIKQACEALGFKHVKVRAIIKNGEEVKRGRKVSSDE
jgi:hypothetical protein